VEISFRTEQLRELCTSAEAAEEFFPQSVAQSLRSVVADLRASRFLDEFSMLQGVDAQPTIAIVLANGFLLKLVCGHRVAPTTDGRFDPKKVYRVRVQDIAGEADD
jgi:hypothetical protein